MIRMPNAASDSAMSSSKERTLEILIPGASVISYSVMVGPTVALMLSTVTPKLPSTCTMRSLLARCSSMSIYDLPSFSYFFSKSSVGYL